MSTESSEFKETITVSAPEIKFPLSLPSCDVRYQITFVHNSSLYISVINQIALTRFYRFNNSRVSLFILLKR